MAGLGRRESVVMKKGGAKTSVKRRKIRKRSGVARRPPCRSAAVWAREFVEEVGNGIVRFEVIEKLAASDERLRERSPVSVAAIVRGSAATLGVSLGEWLSLIPGRSMLLTVQASKVQRQMKELGALLGLDRTGIVRVVRAHPAVLAYGSGNLRRRAMVLRKVVGLPVSVWKRCLRRNPNMMLSKVETVRKLVLGQRKILDLDAKTYAKLVERDPRVLSCGADKLAAIVQGMVAMWGLSPWSARDFIRRRPMMARAGLMTTLDRNLNALAEGFHVPKERLVRAVMSFPPLAYQKPERLLAVVESGARLLGVPRKAMVEAGVRSPSLLARVPGDLGARMRFVKRIAAVVGAEVTATEVLRKFPAALTYGNGRLLQRYTMAKLGVGPRGWMALLSLSDAKARAKLGVFFRERGDHAATREALVRRELL